ncbi:energy transducer TonB [Draconibacterium orientale]|uniref:energy transducer TonB n=1 Tax=Draconibacterium orientale TaxID=1168034 RepID=UPI002A0A1364|nr:energy transducer TonB [Draconibacterium orientale]
MKKVVFIMLALFISMLSLSQNDTPSVPIDEVEISPPAFTGIENYIDIARAEVNNLQEYISANIKYPEEANLNGREGTEVIKFNVNARGQVTDIDIVNGVCPEIDDELVRVLESTNGMWKPGIKDGIPVSMEQEVSIVFSLSGNAEQTHEKFVTIATTCFSKGAECFFEKGKAKRAEQLFTRGMTYMPHDQSLLLMRGLCRYERGNHEGAREDWTRLVELGSTVDMNSDFFVQIEGLEGYEALTAILEGK